MVASHDPSMMQEELFEPVLYLVPFSRLEEAIAGHEAEASPRKLNERAL